MFSSGRSTRRRRSLLAALVSLALVAAGLVALVGSTVAAEPAAADTAPADPSLETVTAAALPTVQINGVVWAQVIVGNRVYATGQFTSARPAGAALGTNETPRSNILAYDITTGALITSWAPSLNAQGLAITASADGSTIYVAGDFDRVNGAARSRIAAIDATTGALVPSFTAGADAPRARDRAQRDDAVRRRVLRHVRRPGTQPARGGEHGHRRGPALGSQRGP